MQTTCMMIICSEKLKLRGAGGRGVRGGGGGRAAVKGAANSKQAILGLYMIASILDVDSVWLILRHLAQSHSHASCSKQSSQHGICIQHEDM